MIPGLALLFSLYFTVSYFSSLIFTPPSAKKPLSLACAPSLYFCELLGAERRVIIFWGTFFILSPGKPCGLAFLHSEQTLWACVPPLWASIVALHLFHYGGWAPPKWHWALLNRLDFPFCFSFWSFLSLLVKLVSSQPQLTGDLLPDFSWFIPWRF